MQIDLELYRKEVLVSASPPVKLSVIDISPDNSRRTFVFLHGFGGQALQWQYQLQYLSNQHRAIAIDLRGHGRSDRPRSRYTKTEIQTDLQAVFEALRVDDPFVLVGHSFGGAIAAEFAADHPDRLTHLVLIATAGEFKLNPFYRAALNLPIPILRASAPLTRNWLGAPPSVLQRWYDGVLSQWRGWEVFPRIAVPTLVIRGHLDLVFARPLFERVSREIPAAEEVDVGASGHLVMLERREAVNRAIERFVEGVRRSWRQGGAEEESYQPSSLLQERPWLARYDEGVPYTISVPNLPLPHLLSSTARRFGGKTALVYEGKRMSYRRLEAEVNRFANALLNLGLRPGERVLLFLPNVPQIVISFFAVLKAGGVVIFVLPTTEVKELARQVCEVKARFLVTLTQFDDLVYQLQRSALIEQGCQPLEKIIFTHVADYLPPGKRIAMQLSAVERDRHLLDIPLDSRMLTFTHLMEEQSSESPELEIDPAGPAVIHFTGGTTSQPKGVVLSHQNLIANTLQTRHWLPKAKEGDERILGVVPIAHSYGLIIALNVPVSLGAMLILQNSYNTERLLENIQRYRPTIFPGAPHIFNEIKNYPGVRKFGLHTIKVCVSGSSPLPVEIQEAFEKQTRCRLVEGYGLTEAGAATHANPIDGYRKVGSIGIPLPSTEARIVDLNHPEQETPRGQVGELAIRGPQVMLGYWNDEAGTKAVMLPGGWLLTGDVALTDEEGFFRIVSRKADMGYLEKEGLPIFPRDIEEILYEIPQVKEVTVVIVAGQPVAFVIARAERPSAESLIAYARRRLPSELVPRFVIFVDEFPRTFVGKILRRELARRFQADREQVSRVEIQD